MEEIHPVCPGCPNQYLYIKGALLLINSLVQNRLYKSAKNRHAKA